MKAEIPVPAGPVYISFPLSYIHGRTRTEKDLCCKTRNTSDLETENREITNIQTLWNRGNNDI